MLLSCVICISFKDRILMNDRRIPFGSRTSPNELVLLLLYVCFLFDDNPSFDS